MRSPESCLRCGKRCPAGRAKYCSRACARYAAVLMYRERKGESYRKGDAARKRFARYGVSLRAEVARLDRSRAAKGQVNWREAEQAAAHIRHQFLSSGPHPSISSRATLLFRKYGPRPGRQHADLWFNWARLWTEVGQPRKELSLIHSQLKQIELFELERHNYRELGWALLRRGTLYSQLLESPWDRYYEAAKRVEKSVADLLAARGRGEVLLQQEHAHLRLHLAELRGNHGDIRRELEAVERTVEAGWNGFDTYFERVVAYTILGDLKRAESADRLLARTALESDPALFNEMRRLRARVMLLFAVHADEEARSLLEDRYRRLCAMHRSWPDVRFWQIAAKKLGLPQIRSDGAIFILFPGLGT